MRRVAKFLRCLAASDLARNKRVLNNAHRRQLLHRLEASRLAMSRQTFIFVSAQAQDPDLMHLVEQALGGTFRYEEGSDPYIRVGPVAVYAGGHEFDDDDIA